MRSEELGVRSEELGVRSEELGVRSEELGVGGEGGSIAVAVWGVLHGAAIVRAHDVKGTAEALRVIGALRG